MADADRLEKCHWCWRRDVKASTWEQEALKGGWYGLCARCAAVRLKNPFNALLPMRKVGTGEGAAVEVVHVCPPDGEFRAPCCGKTPFELSPTDRMTLDPSLATCRSDLKGKGKAGA